MRTKLIAGNWKMNGSRESAQQLLTELLGHFQPVENVECAVFPPFIYLPQVTEQLLSKSIKVGAQTLSEFKEGAYTGDVSAAMLREFACQYVLVGHSERRSLFAETDQHIAAKFERAVEESITPILCVGESLTQRDQNKTEEVISRQLDYFINAEKINLLAHGVIAYEPVWAIGTGKTATPEQAQNVHSFIRAMVSKFDKNVANKLRILYGGSVKSAGAKALLSMPDIDGGLIGGASLNAAEFLAIYNAAGLK